MELQGRDALLQRLLPFGVVLVFLAASGAFASPAAGAISLFGTMAGVLIAYLTGRNPPPSSPSPPSPP